MIVDDTKGTSFLPRTRKTRAALAVLAMASPKPVLRLQLASLLWSRRENEQARASLRQSVHELQDTLGSTWSHIFIADRHYLSLRGAELDIDALTLAQPGAISAELLDRYEDVLLEDLGGLDPAFDRWLDVERARFLRIGRTIGESLIAQCDNPRATIEAAEQLLAIDRRHEGAWRAIIRSYAEHGDFGSALSSYERCRGVLAEVSDARPSPETEHLASRIRAESRMVREPDGAAPAPAVAVPVASAAAPGGRNRVTLGLRVVPLRAIGEERDDGLGIGLAEEISAGLSRFRWISCLSGTRLPTGVATGPSVGSLTASGDSSWSGTDADLILDGTIQRGAGRIRIIVRLVDMRAGGEIVWAGRFDREQTDTLTLQDELGAAIVAQVDPELMQHEARHSAATRPNDLTAQDLLLQALPAIYRLERDSFLHARRMLEMSLRSDPCSSVAHGWLAYWDLLYIGQRWAPDPAATSAEAARLAERAVILDPGDARALTLAGHVRGFLSKRPEEGCALHERAIALNPNLAIAWCFSGLAHCYLGRHDEALRRMSLAQRLSPSDPHGFFFDTALCVAHLMRGDYARAIDPGRRAVEMNPFFSSAHKGYLSALGWMDRTREAGEVLGRLLLLEPHFSVREAIERSPLTRPEDICRFAEGLRRAGLPEEDHVLPGDRSPLAIQYSPIDLAPGAPHTLKYGAESTA